MHFKNSSISETVEVLILLVCGGKKPRQIETNVVFLDTSPLGRNELAGK